MQPALDPRDSGETGEPLARASYRPPEREPGPWGANGSGCAVSARGCGTVLLVLVVVAAVAAVALLNSIRVGGEEQRGVPVDARWSGAEATLSAGSTTAAFRVVISYDPGSANDTDGAVVSIGSPTLPDGVPTPDALALLRDPVVRVSVAGDSAGSCYAACQVPVALRCLTKCSQTLDVRLDLVDAAARSAVRVSITAGATARTGAHLPASFTVRVEPVAAGQEG